MAFTPDDDPQEAPPAGTGLGITGLLPAVQPLIETLAPVVQIPATDSSNDAPAPLPVTETCPFFRLFRTGGGSDRDTGADDRADHAPLEPVIAAPPVLPLIDDALDGPIDRLVRS